MNGVLIGIDVIDNGRFRKAMKRHPGILERVFTERERSYCLSRPNPPQHFAARFAAKEAVGKALGSGVTSWQEIEVGGGGAPKVKVRGGMLKAAQQAGAGPLTISISHSDSVSVSVAVAPKAYGRR
jgi:holo-[acyl-carrier protein] synthase